MRRDQSHLHDEHFREFISKLEPVLAEHGTNTDELQKYQVTKLMTLERKFRTKLVRHKWGPEVYQAFIEHILNVKRNILMARPYFRERDTTFKAHISPVLKEKDHLRLYRFDINFQFIEFALKQRPWYETARGRELEAIAAEVRDIRNDLAECNMPLAISQARMFLERNRKSHLRFMDMNQTCFVGLLEGIDKYVGPYHRRFRAVLIGRMLGNLIEANSETFVHFFPPDKRRIYRARKIIGQMGSDGPVDLEEVCRRLNKMEKEDNAKREVAPGKKEQKPEPLTTLGELVTLLAAAQVISSSALPANEDEESAPNVIDRYPADASARPDIVVEEAQARHSVKSAIALLPLVDQKLLRMRGVEL